MDKEKIKKIERLTGWNYDCGDFVRDDGKVILEINRFNNTFMNLTTSNLKIIKKVIEILEGDTNE